MNQKVRKLLISISSKTLLIAGLILLVLYISDDSASYSRFSRHGRHIHINSHLPVVSSNNSPTISAPIFIYLGTTLCAIFVLFFESHFQKEGRAPPR